MSLLTVARTDSGGVELRLAGLARRLAGEPLRRELGELLKARVLARTAAGLDADGQRFAPYVQSYGRRRQRAGRGAVVNLRFTGEMLDSLAVVLVPDGAALGLGTAVGRERARQVQRRRRFLGANGEDVQVLKGRILEQLRAEEEAK